MSADIVERLQSAGHFYARPHDAILYEAAAEIVRLRGEVAERADDLTTAYMAGRFDGKTIAPAEAKGDPECPQCGFGLLYECVACSATNYPQPADGEAVAPFTHVCRFSDEFPWELTVHGKKHCEKCVPLYTHPPAAQVHGEAVAEIALSDDGYKIGLLGPLRAHRLPLGTKLYDHPSTCELGAVRALAEKWRLMGDPARAMAAQELEAALQHRGDSRGGEG